MLIRIAVTQRAIVKMAIKILTLIRMWAPIKVLTIIIGVTKWRKVNTIKLKIETVKIRH